MKAHALNRGERGIKPVYVPIRYIREPWSRAGARLLCCIMLRNLEGYCRLLPPLARPRTHMRWLTRTFSWMLPHTIQRFPISLPFPPAVNGSRQKCCMDRLRLASRWLSGKLPFGTDSGAATLWYNTTSQLRGPVGWRRWREAWGGKKNYPAAVIQTAGVAPLSFISYLDPIKVGNSTADKAVGSSLIGRAWNSQISWVCGNKGGNKEEDSSQTKGDEELERELVLEIFINVELQEGQQGALEV